MQSTGWSRSSFTNLFEEAQEAKDDYNNHIESIRVHNYLHLTGYKKYFAKNNIFNNLKRISLTDINIWSHFQLDKNTDPEFWKRCIEECVCCYK